MEDNPYLKLAELLQPKDGRKTAAGLLLGRVISAPDEDNPDRPLKISVSGTVQQAEDLMKNAALGAMDFAAGDTLLLLPIDEAQRYIIFCKVVSV